jgi:hypothetical protein
MNGQHRLGPGPDHGDAQFRSLIQQSSALSALVDALLAPARAWELNGKARAIAEFRRRLDSSRRTPRPRLALRRYQRRSGA